MPSNGLFVAYAQSIMQFAIATRLPTILSDSRGVEAGGLTGYGVYYREFSRSAAVYVDKILKGAKPGGLPMRISDKALSHHQSEDCQGP